VAEGSGSAPVTDAATPAPRPAPDASPAGAVFISYASQDAGVAQSLCTDLERHGVACWIAPRDVRPGDFYADSIVQAINACTVLLLVLSQNSIDSAHVLREVERASAKKRPIIAFRIDATPLPPGLEYFLSASQWIDASAAGAERLYPKLIEAIRSRQAAAPAPETDPRPATGSRSKSGRLVPAVAVAVVIALGLAYLVAGRFWFARRATALTASPTSATPPPSDAAAPSFAPPAHSIAVLPFVNMSGDPKQDYFSDGLSEELLNSLAAVRDLQVAARTSSFTFKGTDADVGVIARKLNVGAVLEGSVRKDGNQVRITAQLINALTGYHLWSQTYDRDLKSVLALQTEIATAVTKALQATLLADAATTIEDALTRRRHWRVSPRIQRPSDSIRSLLKRMRRSRTQITPTLTTSRSILKCVRISARRVRLRKRRSHWLPNSGTRTPQWRMCWREAIWNLRMPRPNTTVRWRCRPTMPMCCCASASMSPRWGAPMPVSPRCARPFSSIS
jgi:TolB-like protein